ncbi:MAG: hypothetical protein IJA75_03805 [Oscillospiraceae bacterium]|nr:hypothetical protein [Oscillospiraceae bacterium]
MDNNQAPKRNPKRRPSPLKRNRRLQGKLLSWLLIGSIVLLSIAGLVVEDREFSDSENRKLAQWPDFSLSGLLDGSYLQGMGDYIADQFPLRDQWISLNLKLNQLLGQKESSGVYLCEDNYLIQIPSAPNEEQHERNLNAINTFARNHPELNMVMTVAPNAVTIHADKLPENAPVRDQMADLYHIADTVTGVKVVDVTQTLKSHADEYLYYRTDHHWTSLAAYYAFRTIAPELKITAPGMEEYAIYPVSTTFEGTLSSKSGSHSALDTVEIMVPKSGIDYFVTYNSDSNTNICSLYNRAALEQKDHYTVFFGGNYSRVDITTTARTERSLLVFKDSYANCMIQFLYPYFDHITMIDPRYYYDNVEHVITSQGITDVLFLYNADTFLGDTSLADVLVSE